MASLTQQMEQLQEQQRILAEKIKEDEARKHKEGLNIERLEVLNTNQKESIKQFHTSGRGKYRGVSELQQINVTTAPRFEVILEILKKQDARIRELENIINSPTTTTPSLPDGWVARNDITSGRVYYQNATTGEASWTVGHAFAD